MSNLVEVCAIEMLHIIIIIIISVQDAPMLPDLSMIVQLPMLILMTPLLMSKPVFTTWVICYVLEVDVSEPLRPAVV